MSKQEWVYIIILIVFTVCMTLVLSGLAQACGAIPATPPMPVGCTDQWLVCIDNQWVWACN